MNQLLLTIAVSLLSTSLTLAAGTHNSGHGSDEHHDTMASGKTGEASAVTRTVEITMLETDDGAMLFEPSLVSVQQGETIRFAITNAGSNDHEFVIDQHMKNMEHKKLMEKFPEMEHDDPNSVRLKQGENGEIIWQFSNNEELEFACLIPGHYELGMKGVLEIVSK